MWFAFAIAHVFLLALTNYIDEYLTGNNKVAGDADIHTRIGGLLLVSTILSFIGGFVLWVFLPDIWIAQRDLLLGFFSAVPIVVLFALYFYLLTIYPAYQVVPLFLISSVWLLCIELVSGGSVTLIGLLGIFVLMAGAYLLDAKTFKWQIPTKLFLISLPLTSTWAIALFMVRVASAESSAVVVSFWQLVGIGTLGVLLFLFVKKYRDGLFFRIKHQGKNFLGFSFLNEGIAQISYVFGNLAVAAAPVATYVTAMSGVQSVFLLLLFLFFPIKNERTRVTRLEILAIILIAIGVFLIER